MQIDWQKVLSIDRFGESVVLRGEHGKVLVLVDDYPSRIGYCGTHVSDMTGELHGVKENGGRPVKPSGRKKGN